MSLATLFQEVENVFRPTGIRVSEKEDSFVIEALVAGVNPKEIEIALEKGALTITGKTGSYQYSYLVPFDGIQIDSNEIPDAVAEHGILKVTIPKAKSSKPLKIGIKTS